MYYLFFFGWLVSATALHASSLLGCLESEDGVVSQLFVAINDRGTYDATVVEANRGRLQYLAIDLDCTELNESVSCVAAPSSPHVGSSLASSKVASVTGNQQRVVINSPLTGNEPLIVRECSAGQRRLPATPPSKGCLAYFQGAYYNPDLGDCVAEQASGCRNPYPYLDVNECRVAMHLPARP